MVFKKRNTPGSKQGVVRASSVRDTDTVGVIIKPGTKYVKGTVSKGKFGGWMASQLRSSGLSFEKSMGSDSVWYNQSTGEMVTVPKRVETQEQAKTVLRNLGVLKQE